MQKILAVTTYNRLPFLKEMIGSFFKYTKNLKDWTLILADDGSNDGTKEFIQKMDFPNIFKIYNQRVGISNQTNSIFLKLSQFEKFVCFKSDDDVIFIKDGWDKIFRSYVIFEDKVDYYFVSSDGCQEFIIDHSYKEPQPTNSLIISNIRPKTGVYDDILGDNAFYDLNKPFHPFFEGLIKSLNEVITPEQANARLTNLIENGLYSLNNVETELKSISDPTLDDDKKGINYALSRDGRTEVKEDDVEVTLVPFHIPNRVVPETISI
jgi:glycosyltransferase involved in cell wall biosynthesis